MLWMSGDFLGKEYEDKILLIENGFIRGVVEGINWKANLVLRSRAIRRYGFDELAKKLKTYIKEKGPLPKDGLLFSENAKRFL